MMISNLTKLFAPPESPCVWNIEWDIKNTARECTRAAVYHHCSYFSRITGTSQVSKPRTKKVVANADLKTIGRRIREIRGFDLTQAQFGRLLGVSQRQLSNYELGLNSPTADFLLRLKAFSGKSIDWILTGEAGEKAN
jgi:DNA-binding transcriptional regulator YiaG